MRTRATLLLQYVPLPLRGPVNSTCVKAGGGGLREAPALRPPLRFLVYLQRFAFLPKDFNDLKVEMKSGNIRVMLFLNC